jgi:hypothetical protein
MKAETERFLDLVRDAEDPTALDEQRVRRSLRAAVAAGAASSVVVSTSALPSAASKTGLFGSAGGSVVAKGGLVFVFAVGALSVAHVATRSEPEAPRLSERPASVQVEAQVRQPSPSVEVPAELKGGPAPDAPREQPPAPLRSARVEVKPAVRQREAAAVSSAASLRKELALLSEVQADLRRGDGAGALAKLSAHDTGDQQLLAERRAARILALCANGDVEQAAGEARRFLVLHPDSPQRDAVLRSCYKGQRIDEP